ncbi:MAG: hypothetical protein Q8P01_00530 [bacterium]|nr:hypothetical protein [bacterium]
MYEAELKSFLITIGVNEKGVQEVFTKLDELGVGDTPQSTAGEGMVPAIDIALDEIELRAISTPDAEDTKEVSGGNRPGSLRESNAGLKEVSGIESETEIIEIKDGDDMTARRRPTYTNITLERAVFYDTAKNIIQNIRSAAPEERENLKEELKANRETFQTEIVSMNLTIRENAKDLRDNFRENVKTTIGHVDHGKTARIAVAHGKGLRMLNRFRSAMVRFDHILARLESRVNKLEAEGIPTDSFFDVFTSIEEAKNMQVENEAKMEELKAKYESLLLSEKAVGFIKIDGIEGEKAFIKFDGVEGEKATGYLKLDGIDGEKAYGYLKIDGVKGNRIYLKLDGIDGKRAYIKLGDIKGEISQGIGEEARQIAQELKTEIENLHAKLRSIADDIKQAGKDYNSSISNNSTL